MYCRDSLFNPDLITACPVAAGFVRVAATGQAGTVYALPTIVCVAGRVAAAGLTAGQGTTFVSSGVPTGVIFLTRMRASKELSLRSFRRQAKISPSLIT